MNVENHRDAADPGRVLVAMSGGVDSSVALLKIMEAGYEAVGVTMKLWEYRDVGGNILSDSNCCSVEAINNAREVCSGMGISHYTVDFRDVFRETVVENFVEEYIAGRTPNPCVRCNAFVKWDALMDLADQLGADKIATGHYARLVVKDGSPQILKGRDLQKDQSYVLWGIPRRTLNRTLLPLGGLTKEEVRQLARHRGLATAEIPESQEICFVTDNDYRRFLQEYAAERIAQIDDGEIVDANGDVLGTHDGYINYTRGQRKGLGLARPEPVYVTDIDRHRNRIAVGRRQDLLERTCTVGDVNWLVEKPVQAVTVQAKIRYNTTGADADLTPGDGGQVRLEFSQPQLAITPGQSAVFYSGDLLLGGGIISSVN